MFFFYQAHATPCKEQTNIYDPLYNNNSDYVKLPNRALQVLNPIKTNHRNRTFNRIAKLRYLTLLFKLLLSVSLSNSLLLATS